MLGPRTTNKWDLLLSVMDRCAMAHFMPFLDVFSRYSGKATFGLNDFNTPQSAIVFGDCLFKGLRNLPQTLTGLIKPHTLKGDREAKMEIWDGHYTVCTSLIQGLFWSCKDRSVKRKDQIHTERTTQKGATLTLQPAGFV